MPKALESRFVVPVLNTVRLNTLKASPRRSSRNDSPNEKVLARVMFSLSGGNARRPARNHR